MQVFYSQMCDLIKLGLNGRVFQCPPCGEAMLAGWVVQNAGWAIEWVVHAEIRSQRTQTSQHPGQPIAMSEKSSNFAVAFGDAPHVHRTFIALPSHTRTSAAAERRSSSAKARVPEACGCPICPSGGPEVPRG